MDVFDPDIINYGMIVIKMKGVVEMVRISDNKSCQKYKTGQIKIQFFLKPGFHECPVFKLIINYLPFVFHPASN